MNLIFVIFIQNCRFDNCNIAYCNNAYRDNAYIITLRNKKKKNRASQK